ncbi:MAG TPA: hypothetical protein VGO90_15140 [Chthoniobacteraceae bacterium]|jgi:hypothetical protein|nr:hypothetical protein [Chthoniobacteraceae bacterium]
MKTLWVALTCAVLCTASLSAAPALSAAQAVAIAQASLHERGLTAAHYISALKLEAGDARRSKHHWAVTWSTPVPVSDVKKELGLEIKMDGSIVSLVKGPANRSPTTGKFDPNGPTGLQNHRTRADRTSILDLKH